MSIEDIAEAIEEIALRESFTPMGFFQYITDVVNNPAAYGEAYTAIREKELFASHIGICFADITKAAARMAEGIVDKPPPEKYLYGHTVAAVARWMGSEGWNYLEAKDVLRAKGVDMEKAKIIRELERGTSGEGVAPLLEGQINELYEMLDIE
jgi:hypothetical protein